MLLQKDKEQFYMIQAMWQVQGFNLIKWTRRAHHQWPCLGLLSVCLIEKDTGQVHRSELVSGWEVCHSLPASTYFNSGALGLNGQVRHVCRYTHMSSYLFQSLHISSSHVSLLCMKYEAMKPGKMQQCAATRASLVPHPLAPDSGHTLMHSNVLQWSTCNSIINS